jgi:hypothetical protein
MEPIIGAPAVVGFGNGYGHGDVGVGLAALLAAQRQGTDFCAVSRDIHMTASENHVAIERAASANLVATVENAHNVEVAIEKTAAAGLLATKVAELATANQFAIAALTAANNTAAIQAAIAACCCETKQLITATANTTDSLIRQIDTDNAKQALQDAKNELLAIKYGHGGGPS